MEYWKRLRESGVGNDLLILPGANVFIENAKGEILMHKGYEHDFWRNIGGLADDDESLWQCGTREVKEETNLDVKNLVPFAIRDDPNLINKKYNIFLHSMSFFTKDYSGKIVMDKTEIKELGWLDLTDEKYKFRKGTQRFVNAFLEWKQTGQFQYITNKG